MQLSLKMLHLSLSRPQKIIFGFVIFMFPVYLSLVIANLLTICCSTKFPSHLTGKMFHVDIKSARELYLQIDSSTSKNCSDVAYFSFKSAQLC